MSREPLILSQNLQYLSSLFSPLFRSRRKKLRNNRKRDDKMMKSFYLFITATTGIQTSDELCRSLSTPSNISDGPLPNLRKKEKKRRKRRINKREKRQKKKRNYLIFHHRDVWVGFSHEMSIRPEKEKK